MTNQGDDTGKSQEKNETVAPEKGAWDEGAEMELFFSINWIIFALIRKFLRLHQAPVSSFYEY